MLEEEVECCMGYIIVRFTLQTEQLLEDLEVECSPS
jgi:hypothetical protein